MNHTRKKNREKTTVKRIMIIAMVSFLLTMVNAGSERRPTRPEYVVWKDDSYPRELSIKSPNRNIQSVRYSVVVTIDLGSKHGSGNLEDELSEAQRLR